MTEHPIIFSAPMVRAILEGRKAQTRRVIKPQPSAGVRQSPFVRSGIEDGHGRELRCPHGQPGDRLYVRESFSGPYEWQTIPPAGWGWDTGTRPPIWYWADGNPKHGDWTRPKPSIHMPRWASRILLEITDVRVQRVQDISQMDALDEGIDTEGDDYNEGEKLQSAGSPVSAERFAFAQLWDSINTSRGYGWAENPWVWALTFKRVEDGERE